MIPPEQQVSSLELSRRLNELGVPQNSLFYWHRNLETGYYLSRPDFYANGVKEGYLWEAFSAFTVAELGAILKKYCTLKQLHFQADVAARGGYLFDADFWAFFLIYLIENGLITL